MTLQELIDRALSVASAGLEPSTAPSLSADMVAEDLLLQVFSQVGVEAAREERLRHTLRRVKTLNIADGLATLPGDVLSAYITDSVLIDPSDLTKRYSYLPWEAMVRDPLDDRLGHYSIEGEGRLRAVEPGSDYSATSGPTISLSLTIPCVPEVPATPSTAIAVHDEIADILVQRLAEALRPVRTAR